MAEGKNNGTGWGHSFLTVALSFLVSVGSIAWVWGRLDNQQVVNTRAIEMLHAEKASKEVLQEINSRLQRIETNMDTIMRQYTK